MIKVYASQTLWMVTNVKNLLEARHISCEIRNEYAQGGVGELSFVDAWPEVWVAPEDAHLAKCCIKEMQLEGHHTASDVTTDWFCPCGEANGASFYSCWACQRDRPNNTHDKI